MPRGQKILKTRILSRSQVEAKIIESILLKGKEIRNPKHSKKEMELFHKFMVERQSMKRAVAMAKWEKYIQKALIKKTK